MDRITLQDVVTDLRTQIIAARTKTPKEGLHFDITEAEITLQGTITRDTEAGGGGKVKFSILGFGAEADGSGSVAFGRSDVHTVKLKLDVYDTARPGERVLINKKVVGKF